MLSLIKDLALLQKNVIFLFRERDKLPPKEFNEKIRFLQQDVVILSKTVEIQFGNDVAMKFALSHIGTLLEAIGDKEKQVKDCPSEVINYNETVA